MAGDLEARLNRAEETFKRDENDFLELGSGELVYVDSMTILEDYLGLWKGQEIDDDRARIYADALDDPHHGGILGALIRRCQHLDGPWPWEE